jgi:hypothetical protein
MFSSVGYSLLSYPAIFYLPRLALLDYEFIQQYLDVTQDGLSHTEIHGSMLVCSSPRLIATYYVLLRLLAPRHPPFALSSLITKVFFDSHHLPFLTPFRLKNFQQQASLKPQLIVILITLFFTLYVVVKEQIVRSGRAFVCTNSRIRALEN